MDDRNGQLYPSREAALAAGVPKRHVVEVEPVVVRQTSGPFRGRCYERLPGGGLKRRRELESRQP